MKKLVFLFLVFAQITFAQDAKEIISNFINSFKSYEVVQYSMKYSFVDKSKGASDYSYNCTEAYIKEDTLINGFYNYKSEDAQYIYTGNFYYEYYPEFYGKSVVKKYIRKKNPDEFTGYEMDFMGEKAYAPGLVKRIVAYDKSLLGIYNDFNDSDYVKKVRIISDTVINNIECCRIRIDYQKDNDNSHQIFTFNKNNSMPICTYSYVNFEEYEQEHLAFYSDYSFNSVKKEDVFSKKAFPQKYKFKENPKRIDTKKEITLKINTVAPDFELMSINDNKYILSELKGKIVFLIFSEIGCVPCMSAIPELNEIAKQYQDIAVLSIYPLDSKEALQKLAKKKEMTYEILYNSKDVGKKYFVRGYPTFMMVDKQGILKYISTGYGEGKKDELIEEIEKLIKE